MQDCFGRWAKGMNHSDAFHGSCRHITRVRAAMMMQMSYPADDARDSGRVVGEEAGVSEVQEAGARELGLGEAASDEVGERQNRFAR